MIIRAIVEFHLSDDELEVEVEGEDGQTYSEVIEPELEHFIGEAVQLKSGEYENLYMGSIISAEEVPEVEKV